MKNPSHPRTPALSNVHYYCALLVYFLYLTSRFPKGFIVVACGPFDLEKETATKTGRRKKKKKDKTRNNRRKRT